MHVRWCCCCTLLPSQPASQAMQQHINGMRWEAQRPREWGDARSDGAAACAIAGAALAPHRLHRLLPRCCASPACWVVVQGGTQRDGAARHARGGGGAPLAQDVPGPGQGGRDQRVSAGHAARTSRAAHSRVQRCGARLVRALRALGWRGWGQSAAGRQPGWMIGQQQERRAARAADHCPAHRRAAAGPPSATSRLRAAPRRMQLTTSLGWTRRRLPSCRRWGCPRGLAPARCGVRARASAWRSRRATGCLLCVPCHAAVARDGV